MFLPLINDCFEARNVLYGAFTVRWTLELRKNKCLECKQLLQIAVLATGNSI